MAEYLRLLALPEAELAQVDPLEMNLLVAKSVPGLEHLDIPRYQAVADELARAVRACLPGAERMFWQTPQDWKNDVNFFRLGVLCDVLDRQFGVAYKEDQREVTSIAYTDPSDLFLNGVMDTRRGTCANMAALHVVIGRRLGWPVSLACVKAHYVCRYDDGKVTHNIEVTRTGNGCFASNPDEMYIKNYKLPPVAVQSGSDLTALSTRQVLGVFVGLRARHMRDTGRYEEAELDYLLARRLFPNNRLLYTEAMALAIPRGARLFEPGELGSPESLAETIAEQYGPVPKVRHEPESFSTAVPGVDFEPVYIGDMR